MTFKDQLERAAEEYAFGTVEDISKHSQQDIMARVASREGFKACARWALNSEVVKGLREAAEQGLQNTQSDFCSHYAEGTNCGFCRPLILKIAAFDKALAEVGE